VAVVFLFSYVNPAHERSAAAILREACPGTEVVCSSEVCPMIREYPRTSTAVVNAALRPLVSRYLADLGSSAGAPVLVMQSNGGVLPASEAAALGHQLLVSGPAGGVVGASLFAGRHGVDHLVTMDMGGTSFDTCLVLDGRPAAKGEVEVAGYPVLTSAVDLVTVGAGGGSLARVDPGGALRVGPGSAGADPGPACYGRGGSLPTVTDANLVLGRINPERFLDGRLALDGDAARKAVQDHVARPLGVSVERAAHAILSVVSATMGRALRVVTVGRGRDPATLPLVAFGGAGPLHAAGLAGELGAPTVLVPPLPGFVSAIGLLATELRTEVAETLLAPGKPAPGAGAVRSALSRLGRVAVRRLGREARGAVLSTALDCRYEGQGYELTVPLDAPTAEGLARAKARFHELHDAVYGHAAPAEPVEIVSLRVTASAPGGGFEPSKLRHHRKPRPAEVRKVYDGAGWAETPVLDRSALPPGWRGSGPLVVEEGESTTWVPAGWTCSVDDVGTLELRRG